MWIMIFAVFLLLIIVIFAFIFLKIWNKPKNNNKKEEEEIEILDVDDYPSYKEVSDDTLNLDDLFKTMSIKVIKDDPNFDFDLIRTNKK